MANYTQSQLPSDIFNSSSGDIKNYNGRAVQVNNPGNGTRDLNDLGDWGTYQSGQDLKNNAAATSAANDARFASDKQELSDFNNNYTNGVNGIISNTSNKYNLPGLLDQANSLNSRVQDLQTNMNGTGSGGYSSGAQVDKAIQTNYLPRAQQAVTNLQTGTTLAQNEENQLMQPYQTQAQLLNDRMARETTGYTAEQQQELDGLVAKMNAGVTLTAAEIGQATALAQAEKTYQGILNTNATTLANTIQGQKYQSIPASNNLVNTVAQGILNPATGKTSSY